MYCIWVVCNCYIKNLNTPKKFWDMNEWLSWNPIIAPIIAPNIINTQVLPHSPQIISMTSTKITFPRPKVHKKSKLFFEADVSSKKRTNEFYFTTIKPLVELFFGGNWRNQKDISKLLDFKPFGLEF